MAVRADAPDAARAIDAYFADLALLIPGGFDPARTTPAEAAELAPPHGVFLVAYEGDDIVGCGGLRTIEAGVGEIKRMWVRGDQRGRGLGRNILEALEDHARSIGHQTIRLDTSNTLTVARRLYEAAGYSERSPYNDNLYAEAWFEKQLDTVERERNDG